jgi:hypothetical protein
VLPLKQWRPFTVLLSFNPADQRTTECNKSSRFWQNVLRRLPAPAGCGSKHSSGSANSLADRWRCGLG